MTRAVSATLALAMALVVAAPARTQNLIFPLDAVAGVATTNDPVLDLSQTWKGVDGGVAFTALRIDITDQVSHALNSKFLELRSNGTCVVCFSKAGDITVSNIGGTSLGGLRRAGNMGEMALTSQRNPGTGQPADVFRYYWEGGVAGGASVLYGMGTNRLSIESNGAIVHVAKNSRYEWEGLGSMTINMVGYQAGSSNGRTINFTNAGQAAEHATPLYATNYLSQVGTIQEWRDARSGAETMVAKVGADGTFTAKTLVLNDVPTSQPATAGALWSDNGVLKVGAGSGAPPQPVTYAWDGTAGGDVVLSSSGTGDFSIESHGALILQSATGQVALETGAGLPRVNLVGYKDGSSLGVPINVTNEGQDAAQQSHPLEVTNVQASVDDIVRFNDGRSGSSVTVASVSADGAVTAAALTLTTLPTTDPAAAGEVWSDGGVLKLSGATAGADPVSSYWVGAAGGDAALSSLGTGRLLVESQAALILQSQTGQMELAAGVGVPRVDIVGHEDGSSLGVPINFTNDGQDTAQQSHAMEITNVQAAVTDIVRFNDGRSGSSVTVASVNADGAVTATGLTLTSLPVSDPATAGGIWSDDGVLKLSGSSGSQAVSYSWDGTAGGDAVLSGAGTGGLSIESPAGLALKSTMGQLALVTGVGLSSVDIVGRQADSTLGVPVNITNAGQDPLQQSHALEVTNANTGVAEIVRFNDARGGTPVTVAAVSADGQVLAKGLTLNGVPTADPSVSGEVWSDDGVLKLSGASAAAQPLAYAWDGIAGGDAVLSSQGTGSLAIESQAALVLQSGAGRMELEAGTGLSRVEIVSYETGTTLGVPVSFTNEGHEPSQKSHALEVTNVHSDIDTIAEFRDGRTSGTTVGATTVAAIGADGTLVAPTAILHNLPTSDPQVAGALWSDPNDGLLRVSAG